MTMFNAGKLPEILLFAVGIYIIWETMGEYWKWKNEREKNKD